VDTVIRSLQCPPGAARRRRQRRLVLRVLASAAFACTAGAATVHVAVAEDETDLERTVKAAFLYKFLNYAEWPASAFADARSPFVIDVYGADAIADALTLLATGRPVAGRAVEVRKLRRGQTLAGAHVLFVGSAASRELPSLARAMQHDPLLIVSEEDGALRLGSCINLLVVNGRVRFDVSLDAAEKAGVKLSSRLLAVARSVHNRGEL
jgi:hypothetical protein